MTRFVYSNSDVRKRIVSEKSCTKLNTSSSVEPFTKGNTAQMGGKSVGSCLTRFVFSYSSGNGSKTEKLCTKYEYNASMCSYEDEDRTVTEGNSSSRCLMEKNSPRTEDWSRTSVDVPQHKRSHTHHSVLPPLTALDDVVELLRSRRTCQLLSLRAQHVNVATRVAVLVECIFVF